MSDIGSATVREETPADRDAALEVVRAAFGAADGPGGAEGAKVAALVEAMRAEQATLLSRALVAVLDDEVVGHVGLTRGWVDAPAQLVEIRVLSPLAVRPDLQGRGLGAALLLAAAQACEQEQAPLVLLEGDPTYYSRHGYVPAHTVGLERPSERIPEPACQVLTLPTYDAAVRGRLVYPDVFWRHDAVGLRGQDLETIEAALSRAAQEEE